MCLKLWCNQYFWEEIGLKVIVKFIDAYEEFKIILFTDFEHKIYVLI